MALQKKGKYWYGTTPEDIQAELVRYSRQNGYQAVKFSQAVCGCGGHSFRLASDEDNGVAQLTCSACGAIKLLGDSAEYLEGAELESHECLCDADVFHIVSGVALYQESNDVRWYYIACRCLKCNLVGVYADWKCEAGDADALLAKC